MTPKDFVLADGGVITEEDYKLALKLLEEYRQSLPCHCDSEEILFCEKHQTIHCDKETLEAIKVLSRYKKRW